MKIVTDMKRTLATKFVEDMRDEVRSEEGVIGYILKIGFSGLWQRLFGIN